jgi:hypothetical protein
MSVYVKSDDFPFWVQLDATAQFQAPIAGSAQQRRDIVFSAGNKLTDPVEGGDGLTGYTFQFAICWTGHCKIKRGRVRANIASEPNQSASIEAEENVTLTNASVLGIDLEATDYDTTW